MANDEELMSAESGENTMLREAVDAVRQGDRARARDLLTRLLKADQNNPTYWVWLSAVVDSPKERLYCLQTALKLDPENAAAKRGLVLLGGLPPDDAVQPFPLNRPRSWEEDISIPKDAAEKPRGWANPVVRIFIVLGILVVAGGLFLGGYNLFRPGGSLRPLVVYTPTSRPTFTVSPTPTVTPVYRTATPTFPGPTPLSFFLPVPYTPTPLYVATVHPPLTDSSFKAGLRFLAAGQYETARVQFQLVLQSEPGAADVHYYIGESYRFEGKYSNARDAYQKAIAVNPNFAPAFLGRALANLGLKPGAEVQADFDTAIALDPQFTEAYIQRAAYALARDNPQAAIADLETALAQNPDSALAWMYLAQAQLSAGDGASALESALRANQLDMTLVSAYLTLGRAYIAVDQAAQAVGVLQTYVLFEPEDETAILLLGTAYNAAGDYQLALQALNQYISAHPRSAEAYFQRGLAYLNLHDADQAEADFKKAAAYDPDDFDSQLGLARAYDLQGKPGNAYIQAERTALPLAKTDQTKAQAYYWIALFLEKIDDPSSAEGARNYWSKLIALPAEVMPQEWRDAAYDRLGITPTFTPTPRFTLTPTATLMP